MREEYPVRADAVVAGISGADPVGPLSVAALKARVQEVLDYTPPALASRMGSLKVHVADDLGDKIFGQFNASANVLQLSRRYLADNPQALRETVLHELFHPLQRAAPAEYRLAIAIISANALRASRCGQTPRAGSSTAINGGLITRGVCILGKARPVGAKWRRLMRSCSRPRRSNWLSFGRSLTSARRWKLSCAFFTGATHEGVPTHAPMAGWGLRFRSRWPCRVVDMNGAAARWAPCPLERRYWLGFIQPELELVARVLKETGAAGGAALELETYCFYSIYPGMASQKNRFCYCDECFYGFLRAREQTAVTDAVPPEHRFNWLTQRGLRLAYEQSLEDRLAAIISEMMRAVRRVNRQFLFGMYPYAPHWYYDALVRGSGTPDLPCLLFSSAEYYGGYCVEPAPTFNGDFATAACVEHLRARGFHALYAGGLYDKGIGSPEAYAVAMDRLLRAAHGFWAYRELPPAEFEPFWKPLAAVNDFHRRHPDPLPPGAARPMLAGASPPLVARYTPDPEAPPALVESFEDETELARHWSGRGALPALDRQVAHSGQASLRFEPGRAASAPQSPCLDRAVPGGSAKPREISFWVKTDATAPVRLYVGTASSDQYPAYMWYYNFLLPARQDWTRVRIAPVTGGNLPRLDVVRFWCEPTDGRLWLDDVEVRPVQEQVLEVPLALPPEVSGWGAIQWQLSPPDAAAQAELVTAADGRLLWKRLRAGDNLAPLAAVVGREPVRLRLRVYPAAGQDVVLEQVTPGAVLPDPG